MFLSYILAVFMFAHNVVQLEQTYQAKHLICKPDIQACTDLRRCFLVGRPLVQCWDLRATGADFQKKKMNVCTSMWKPKCVQ